MKIFSILISLILGTLLHFTYEISHCNKLVGLFSATNESTWEHLKLPFYGIIIVSIPEYLIIGNSVNNFITSKMIAVVFAIIFTVTAFYTYVGIFGKNHFIIDISIFILSVIFGQLISYKIMELQPINMEKYSLAIILFLSMIFAIFTKKPPHIKLFQDPIYKTYGSICKKK